MNFHFYSTDGSEICKERFIQLYRDSYYLCNQRIVPGVSQTSRSVENEIDRLLKNGIKTEIDVVHIMAWKLGKVKQGESEKASENGKVKFVYALDWQDAESVPVENLVVKRYGKNFCIGKLATYIVEHIAELEDRAKNDPQGVLNELRDLNIRGLGPVYLITLLYFISRGTYPIYDRFAALALEAISGQDGPNDKLKFHALPDKTSKKFGAIMDTEMRAYEDCIREIFGSEYRGDNRDVDRALWVYGHRFTSTN